MTHLALFKDIRPEILKELEKAESEIKVAMGWFTNEDLFDTLCSKLKNGVKVELIILNDFINNRVGGLDFQHFIDLGGKFYFGAEEKPMHNKFCIIDKRVLINGSYNWTYFAESKNEENTIIHKENPSLVEAFHDNFIRLTKELDKISKIIKNNKAEIFQNNYFDTYHYLAFDYIAKATFTSQPELIKEALSLLPKNQEVQKAAVKYNYAKRRKTTISIGNEIVGNVLSEIIPKGTEIPASGSSNFTTVSDNQAAVNNRIRYGNNPIANKNKLIGSYTITGIPPMKAGEPGLKLMWQIDLDGTLTIVDMIKQTSNSITVTYDINELLEEVKDTKTIDA